MDSDTITALSTPPGKGGLAVIRLSGPNTLPILSRIFLPFPTQPTPRHAYHGFVTNGNHTIDEGIAIFYQTPSSYTGEDSAEISIHSNPLLVEEVLNLVCSLKPKNARIALPGEFTFRAFKNGKMDLIQAESVNELINANSRTYAHMKFSSLEGKLSHFMNALKDDLVNLAVQVETKIEFQEDQFFQDIDVNQFLTSPLARLDSLLANARFNHLLDKGLNVVIAGKVNVGKSSLFNTLLMEERSIISPTPGTTRDFIKEKIYIDGFPIEITDIAGINRQTTDLVEQAGIERSLAILDSCDAVIFMLDASRPIEDTDKDIYDRIKNKNNLIIANKQDIIDISAWSDINSHFPGQTIIPISVKDHLHIDAVTAFLKQLTHHIKEKETEFTVNQRQKKLLKELRDILCQVNDLSQNHGGHFELLAEDIRLAIDIIGQLMGTVTTDDILEKIFSQFCVGK